MDINHGALDALLDIATGPRRFPSRSKIAAAAGISDAVLSRLASGQSNSRQALEAVAKALDVPADVLLHPAVPDVDETFLAEQLIPALGRLSTEVGALMWQAEQHVRRQTRGDDAA